MVTLTAVLTKENGMYIVENPETGTVSQGKSIEEALDNIKEAVGLYLEEFPLEGTNKPIMTTIEVPLKKRK